MGGFVPEECVVDRWHPQERERGQKHCRDELLAAEGHLHARKGVTQPAVQVHLSKRTERPQNEHGERAK